jgi:1-phosphofructokinase
MIVTVTPNPSLDRTYELAGLERGAVLRADAVHLHPGGKGINVAHALVANGHAARAVVPVGGHDGDHLVALLDATGIEVVAVPIAGEVRTNVSLAEPDGTVTKLNAPGPRLDDGEVAAMAAATVAATDAADWVAGCGSLPPGTHPDLYARLVERAHAAGARVLIDVSGPAFVAALEAGPDLVKPNHEELEEATGRTLGSLADVVDAANEVRARGVGTVVVSLGGDGAVLVDGDGAWHATTPPVTVRSAVGAGDSLVAGLLAGGGRGPDALRLGVAYGTAAAQLPGTQLPGPDDLDADAVRVAPVALGHPLSAT